MYKLVIYSFSIPFYYDKPKYKKRVECNHQGGIEI